MVLVGAAAWPVWAGAGSDRNPSDSGAACGSAQSAVERVARETAQAGAVAQDDFAIVQHEARHAGLRVELREEPHVEQREESRAMLRAVQYVVHLHGLQKKLLLFFC